MSWCGVSTTPTAGKLRTVLGMLAMQPNVPVPLDMLAWELWGDATPVTAKATLQTYIMQLRRALSAATSSLPHAAGPDPKQELVTSPGGYMLAADDDAVDMWRFNQLATAGHRSRELGDFQLSSRQLAEALACWRGRALADVRQGPHLRMQTNRLEEARLNVLDRRIDADLRLGRHHELLAELSALVEQTPHHEGLAAHLMLALYRSGRRGHALDVYRRLRTCLAEELGLDPSPPLRRLQHAMLAGTTGAGEIAECWQAATMYGHRPQPPERSQYLEQSQQPEHSYHNPPPKISPELAAMSWQAQEVTDAKTLATGVYHGG